MAPPESIDAYLATLPPDQQAALGSVRRRIVELAPDAVETISYGMPGFKLGGRAFIWFAGWTSHCSLYPVTDVFRAAHAEALRPFRQTKGSVHFTTRQPLPDALLDALIRDRVAAARGRPSG